eukprot:GHVS01006633.1.p1 GENE.GHVS01006633.1~~GHVS01006633.1.p1  ORF type:complete len:773 (+),score=179.42 GHVS01006633.1:300-2321(+)
MDGGHFHIAGGESDGCHQRPPPPSAFPMNPLDAVWLQDTPTNPFHIVCHCSVEGRVDIQSQLRERLCMFAEKHWRFRSSIERRGCRWWWLIQKAAARGGEMQQGKKAKGEDSGIFNVLNNVYVYDKEWEGGGVKEATEDLVGQIFSRQLPHHFPLWRFHVIYGKQSSESTTTTTHGNNSDCGGGGCTYFIVQVHHCVADGASLAYCFLSDFCDNSGSCVLPPLPPSPPLLQRLYILFLSYARILPALIRVLSWSQRPAYFGAPPAAYNGWAEEVTPSGRKVVAMAVEVPLEWLQQIRRKLRAGKRAEGKTGEQQEKLSVTINDVLLCGLFGMYRRSICDAAAAAQARCKTEEQKQPLVTTAVTTSSSTPYSSSPSSPHLPFSSSYLTTTTTSTHSSRLPSELRLIIPVNIRSHPPTQLANVHAPMALLFSCGDTNAPPKQQRHNSSSGGEAVGEATSSFLGGERLLRRRRNNSDAIGGGGQPVVEDQRAANPVERLKVVKKEMDHWKNQYNFFVTENIITLATSLLPSAVAEFGLNLLLDRCNGLFSNVIGPRSPVFLFGGRRLLDMTFWPPARSKHGWCFAACTYRDVVKLTATADEMFLPVATTGEEQEGVGGGEEDEEGKKKGGTERLYGGEAIATLSGGGRGGKGCYVRQMLERMVAELRELDEFLGPC